MMDTRPLVTIARDDLASQECFCGQAKERRQSFCRACYFALPKNLRMKLYKTLSDGYAEIYDEAKDWLRHNTNRIKA